MGAFSGFIDPISSITGGILNLAGDSLENQWANNSAQHAMDFTASQQLVSQDFNAEQAQKSRDFQERMSNTQYQRATKDMIAAGLNPMLAYSQGGAGTPTGATASSSGGSGTAAAVPHAGIMDAATSAAQINLIDAQARKARAEAAVTEDEFPNISASGERATPKAVSNRLREYQGTHAWYDAQVAMRKADLTDEETRYVHQQIINAATRNELDKLDIPKAINEARAQSDAYMKYIAPYTGEAVKWGSALSSMRGRPAPNYTTNVYKNYGGSGLRLPNFQR